MKCPRDGADLNEQSYESSIDVDACPTCGGMWLDEGELTAIQESKERDHSAQLARMPDLLGAADAMARQRSPGEAACPKCNAQLVTEEYAHCSQILIDACPAGCGVWLDQGEIQSLEVFFERSKAESTQGDDQAIWVLRSFWASLRGLVKKKPS